MQTGIDSAVESRLPTGNRDQLLVELHDLCQPGVTVSDFGGRMASVVARLLGSKSVAIWLRTSQSAFQVIGRESLDASALRASESEWQRHGELLLKACLTVVPVAVAAGEELRETRNTTGMDLLFASSPQVRERGIVIETFFQPVGRTVNPSAEVDAETSDDEIRDDVRERLQLLSHAASFAADYLRGHEIVQLAANGRRVNQWAVFFRNLHRSLDPEQIGFALVNDVRALIDCDRVCLCVRRRDRFHVLAVSGQESVNARSDQVQGLVALAGMTAARNPGQPIVLCDGDTIDLDFDQTVTDYRSRSGSRSLVLCPLRETSPTDDGGSSALNGVLILDRFKRDFVAEEIDDDLATIRQHAQLALANSLSHDRILFRSVRGRIGRVMRESMGLRQSLRILLPILVTVMMVFVPMPFRLPTEGILRARVQQGIFAPEDGIVRTIPVEHGNAVETGQTLAVLENTALSVELEDAQGDLAQNNERLTSRLATRSDSTLSSKARIELDGEIAELEDNVAHLTRRVELLRRRINSLTITAPIDGTVVTWDARRKLINRPVTMGDLLLDVADTNDQWALEVRLPERNVGYILDAWQAAGETSLPADYLLATEPERRYQGRLVEISARTDAWRGDPVVYGIIELDPESLPALREGADVRARIVCGERSVGFVCLRELIEFVHMRVLF